MVEWAKTNTRSTIWSCLAAHAAVLHLDGIERQRLDTKCSGIYDCVRVSDSWLTENVPSPLKISHSRLNELRGGDLAARGYQLLTVSPEAGVDIFAKSCAAISSSSRVIRNMTLCRCSGNICATSPAFSRASATSIRPSRPAISTPRPKRGSRIRAAGARRTQAGAGRRTSPPRPSSGYRRRSRRHRDFQELARISVRRCNGNLRGVMLPT